MKIFTLIQSLTSALVLLLIVNPFSAKAQWNEVSSFPGGEAYSVASFVIGDKVYYGGGQPDLKTFYEYDIANDKWTQKADLGGDVSRGAAISFSINGKGYLGCGDLPAGANDNSFYEYDPNNDTWTKKADFPGVERSSSYSVASNGKGYVFCGAENNYPTNEVWEYDPSTDSWSQKANFPGGNTYWPTGFEIDGIIYVGTGSVNSYTKQFFFAYDPSTDTWDQIAYLTGTQRSSAFGFSIGKRGYIGGGISQDFMTTYNDVWEYNPDTDSWTQMTEFDLPMEFTAWSNAVSVGNNVIFGTGGAISSGFQGSSKVYLCTIDNGTNVAVEQENIQDFELIVYPNPTNDILKINIDKSINGFGKLEVFSISGQKVLNKIVQPSFSQNTIQVDVQELNEGFYFLSYSSQENTITKPFQIAR